MPKLLWYKYHVDYIRKTNHFTIMDSNLKEKILAALIFITLFIIYYNSVVIRGNSFMTTLPRTYRSGHYHYSGTYWHVARKKATIDPAAANQINMPSAYLEHHYLKSLQLPLWNPYSGLGRPYNADMNSYAFFLPIYPFKLWPSLIIYDLFLLLRLFISGFFLFLLLRLYRCQFWISIAGASFYMFNSYFHAYIDMDQINVTMFLSPMVYFLTKFLFSDNKRYLLAFILCSAGSFYGGNPNEFIIIHLFVTFYFIFLTFIKKRADFQCKLNLLLSYGIALGLSILLSSIKLIPFIEFWKNSVSIREGDFYGISFFLTLKKFFAWILIPNKMTGGPNYIGYLALCLVFFSLFNLLRKKWKFREKVIAFHFILLFLFISKINGAPYINWIGQLPVLNNIHYIKYCSLLYYIISVISSFALTYLRENIKSAIDRIIKIFIFLLCSTIPHIILWSISKKSLYQIADDGKILSLVLLIFIVISFFLIIVKKSYKNKAITNWAIVIIGFLVVSELRLNNHQYYRKRFNLNDKAPYTRFLLKQKQPYRAIGIDWTFIPNHNLVYPIPSVNRIFAMRVNRSVMFLSELVSSKFNIGSIQTFNKNEILNNPYLDLLNVRYYISESVIDSIVINPEFARVHGIKELIDNPLMEYTRCGNLYYYLHWGWRQMSDSSVDIPLHLPLGEVYLKSTALAFNFERGKRKSLGNNLELVVSVKHGEEKERVYHKKFSPHSREAKDFFSLTIDLSKYAGQDVIINFSLKNPKPESKNDRMFFWGNLRVTYNKIKKSLAGDDQGMRPSSLADYGVIPYEEVFAHHALVYKNNRAVERGFMLYDVKQVKDINEALTVMIEEPLIYKKTALIEGVPPSNIKIGKVGQSKISFIDYRPNYIMINVETTEDGVFILSDVYYPGWKAYLDRKPVKVYPAFGALRAVFLPKGQHQLVFRYRPWTFYLGGVLTFLSFIFLGWLYFSRVKLGFISPGQN